MCKVDSLPVLTAKLFSSWSWHVQSMVWQAMTFEVWSMKLEMNYSAHQKRDDWRLRRFQSNTPSTEVPICLLGLYIKIRKTFIRVRYSALSFCLSTLNETNSLELTVVFLLLIFEHSIEKPCTYHVRTLIPNCVTFWVSPYC